jgi:hypothetical protein
LGAVFNETIYVLKDLLIAQHPVAIEQHQQWGKLKHLKGVLCKLVIQDWWLLHVIGDNDTLADVLVYEVECCNWEENWHANTVHASKIDDI